MAEPSSAAAEQGIANLSSIKPDFANRAVVSVAPMAELSLFVPMALCTGSPASIYAGSEISPPPPAIASTNPARNTSGQTIMY